MNTPEDAKRHSGPQNLSNTAPSPHVHLPYPRNPAFFGREAELAAIEETLTARHDSQELRSINLHGLGGIGKTQIALEYAYRKLNNYHDVFWIIGVSHSSLLQSFANIATELQLENVTTSDMEKTQRIVLSWLKTSSKICLPSVTNTLTVTW